MNDKTNLVLLLLIIFVTFLIAIFLIYYAAEQNELKIQPVFSSETTNKNITYFNNNEVFVSAEVLQSTEHKTFVKNLNFDECYKKCRIDKCTAFVHNDKGCVLYHGKLSLRKKENKKLYLQKDNFNYIDEIILRGNNKEKKIWLDHLVKLDFIPTKVEFAQSTIGFYSDKKFNTSNFKELLRKKDSIIHYPPLELELSNLKPPIYVIYTDAKKLT